MKLKFTAIVVVLLLAGCQGRESPQKNSPSSDNIPPAQASVPAGPAWFENDSFAPVYPLESDSKILELDYPTYTFMENGEYGVTPLPPHFGKDVRVKIKNPGKYKVTAGGPDCAFSQVVGVEDQPEVSLKSKTKESREFEVTKPGTVLSVRMSPGAENNFSCGIIIHSTTPLI